MPATSRRALGLSFAVALVAMITIHKAQFPGSVPDFERASNGGVLLDIAPAFDVNRIYSRLDGYGEAGRRNYAFRNVTVDVLLPLLLLPFLVLSMRSAVRSLPRAAAATLMTMPFVYVIFDFAENAAVLALLSRYPERMERLASVLPYLTVIKRVASMAALLFPPVAFLVRSLRRRLPQADT